MADEAVIGGPAQGEAHAPIEIDNGMRDSEERLQLALDAAQMGIWEWAIATNKVIWSPHLEAIHGLSPGTFGGTFNDYQADIHPDDRERVLEAVARTLEHGSDHHIEYRIIPPDGRIRWVEGRGRLFVDPSGAPARMIGVCMDITARKQAEEALRASEERFALFMEQLPGLAWIKDLDGRYIYANAAAQRAFRTSASHLYGRRDSDLFPDATAAQFRDNDARALASEGGVEIVETLEHEDGVLHSSLVSKFPIMGLEDRATCIGGIAIDITGLMRAEEALRASEERFRMMANTTPAIIWTTDARGKVTFHNQRWLDYTGLTAEENVEWPPRVLHPGDREHCARAWAEAMEKGTDLEVEARYRHHQGDYRWFLTRATPIRGSDGQVVEWYGSTTDIHDRKIAEERQTLLLQELAHRVKNTLAMVQSIANQTLRQSPEPAIFKTSFLARLAAIGRAHSSLSEQRWEGASLHEVVLTALAPFVDDSRPDIIVIDGCSVKVNPNAAIMVCLVFHELATNAAKYGALSAHNGRVQINWKIKEDKRSLQVRWVESNGPAVRPPDERGFGSDLVERVVPYQFGGKVKLEFRPDGVQYTMTVERSALEAPSLPDRQ